MNIQFCPKPFLLGAEKLQYLLLSFILQMFTLAILSQCVEIFLQNTGFPQVLEILEDT